jgi:hypothetical protein
MILAAGLGVVLTWRAFDAHLTNVELYGKMGEVDREMERAQGERRRLQAELDALGADPMHVERRLRALRHVEPGERLIQPAAKGPQK